MNDGNRKNSMSTHDQAPADGNVFVYSEITSRWAGIKRNVGESLYFSFRNEKICRIHRCGLNVLLLFCYFGFLSCFVASNSNFSTQRCRIMLDVTAMQEEHRCLHATNCGQLSYFDTLLKSHKYLANTFFSEVRQKMFFPCRC